MREYGLRIPDAIGCRLRRRRIDGSVANQCGEEKFSAPLMNGRLVSKLLSVEELFKGRHFDAEINRLVRPLVPRLQTLVR